jgi:hypothetical protein
MLWVRRLSKKRMALHPCLRERLSISVEMMCRRLRRVDAAVQHSLNWKMYTVEEEDLSYIVNFHHFGIHMNCFNIWLIPFFLFYHWTFSYLLWQSHYFEMFLFALPQELIIVVTILRCCYHHQIFTFICLKCNGLINFSIFNI